MSVKRIKLTNSNKFALVDNCDSDLVSNYKWRLSNGYVVSGKGAKIRMHCLIMGIKGIDHINGNSIDNRRSNIRAANQTQNGQNKRPNSNKKYSKFKGVTKEIKSIYNPWVSRIRVNGKLIYLGSFPSEILAAKAYNNAANKYFGEFARINEKCK